MTRLIQIRKGNVRRVGLVEEPNIRLLDTCSSIYELAHLAIAVGMKLSELARQRARHDTMEYGPIYSGRSEWRLLPAMDHPDEAAGCRRAKIVPQTLDFLFGAGRSNIRPFSHYSARFSEIPWITSHRRPSKPACTVAEVV